MRNKGQALIELLVALGISVVILPALLTSLVSSREGRTQAALRLEATALTKEAEEAIRIVREKGWSEISTNGTFHTVIESSTWSLAGNLETLGDFTRQVVVESVYRNSQGTITTSEGTLDPSTKKITVTVSWGNLFPSSIESAMYLTRHNNLVYTETTDTQFDAGTKTSVTVTNTAGGEVILSGGGFSDWCDANLIGNTLDLPKNGVANALTAIEGRAFVGTGENASGVSFANVSITNANPPSASVDGTLDGYKTNAIFGETNYAYIATDTNAEEIAIISISSTPYTKVGYFNSPGSTDASSVFVSGNTGYMTAGNKLYNFDLSSKTGSRPAFDADGVTLAGTGTAVQVVGSYAYVSVDSSPELQIVDTSNSSNLTIVAEGNVDAQGGKDLSINGTGTRVYLATGTSSTQRELFILDSTNKSGTLPLISSYDTSGMDPKAIALATASRVLIGGTGSEEYQVVNTSTESSPTRCGGINVDAGVNGIAATLESDNDAYAYIITGDASAEFKIIEGGPGGQFANTGIFESQVFDAGALSAFNAFFAGYQSPVNTAVRFQIAVSDPADGNCQTSPYNFVGPDLTSNTFFDDSASIPLDDDGVGFENPGRCLKYKVFLDSDDISTGPSFNDITINYSP